MIQLQQQQMQDMVNMDSDAWGSTLPVNQANNQDQCLDRTSDAKLIPNGDRKIYHQGEKISDDFVINNRIELKIPNILPREETKQEMDYETWK